MIQDNETFESLLRGLRPELELSVVFTDFLQLSLWGLSADRRTGTPNPDQLDTAILGRYSDAEIETVFPRLLGLLLKEMKTRVQQGQHADVLGDFFRAHLLDNPANTTDADDIALSLSDIGAIARRPGIGLYIDSSCGTGRRLMKAVSIFGTRHLYWGADEHPLCVLIATMNLLIAGKCSGEIICGRLTEPKDFVFAYQFSHNPAGVKRIEKVEESLFWSIYFDKKA